MQFNLSTLGLSNSQVIKRITFSLTSPFSSESDWKVRFDNLFENDSHDEPKKIAIKEKVLLSKKMVKTKW